MKQKGLSLGNQTGSFMNHLMSHNSTEHITGEGATILHWTDRHAFTVQSVSEDKKTVIIQRCDAKRVDKNGMSESQEYDYSRHTKETKKLVYKYGAWREIITRVVFVNYDELTPKQRQECFDNNAELKLIPGKTKMTFKYEKVSILWGERREYYDYSF